MNLDAYSDSPDSTRELGASLVERLLPDGVLLLRGDLGSGKTVLTQGLASALGIEEREVQSPSFTLVREHQGDVADLVHVDLYRLDPIQVESLGLWEILSGPGVKVVEWSERLPFEVPGALTVAITTDPGSERRRIRVVDAGSRSRAGTNPENETENGTKNQGE